MMDSKVCPVCWSYQGRIFTDEEIVREFPFSEFGYPKIHPNCRCWFKPHYVDEERVKAHYELTEDTWEPLPKPAKYVLLLAFLALLQEDEFKKCVKKERDKGYTKKEAEEICRIRGGYINIPAEGEDEVERSKRLLADPHLRLGAR